VNSAPRFSFKRHFELLDSFFGRIKTLTWLVRKIRMLVRSIQRRMNRLRSIGGGVRGAGMSCIMRNASCGVRDAIIL
jgi:hypothetical protein